MNGVVDLNLIQMATAYIFILILLLIVKQRNISREKIIILSTFRMTVQLMLVGYILGYIFENNHPIYTLIIIAVMEVFAINNVFKRTKREIPKELKKIIAIALFVGTVFTIFFFLLIVVRIKPWYDARYFVPIAGMLVGNAMTGISLGVNNLLEGMHANKAKIESSLMLGATPRDAAKEIVDNAFDSAILPTINSMMGMGIVFLPGMMTGQILSGISPITAIEYQIAIMLGIAGAVSLSTIIFVSYGSKTFFNSEDQLVNF
ncbi:MAG: iron export ABC transporter permease subunit FetB [Peptoniphilus sp.]|nr:iron export ABC transporter permease subunit FetB [Peptoniphilus sp.]